MPITIECEKCGNTFELADKWAGQRVVCRKCGNDFKAPDMPRSASGSPSRIRGLIAAGALAVAIGGGASFYLATAESSAPRIDATSEETFKDSLDDMRASIPEERRREFDQALMLIAMKDQKSLLDMAASSRVPGLTEAQVKQALAGKTADQIFAEAEQVKAERKAEEERRREVLERIEAEREQARAPAAPQQPEEKPVQPEPDPGERKMRTIVMVPEKPLKPKVTEEPAKPEEPAPAAPEISKEEKAVNDALVELSQPFDVKNRFKRREIASSLGTYADFRERIMPVLVKAALNDPDMWTRRRAFWSLAEMGKQDKGAAKLAISTLSKAAQADTDPDNKKAAKQAIEKLLGTEPKK
jgi:hypothetical protein